MLYYAILRIALLAFCSFITASLAAPTRRGCSIFTDLVVFGDSSSDDGNFYKASNDVWPSSPYYRGAFSNGPVWSHYLAAAERWNVHTYAYAYSTSNSSYVPPVAPVPSTPIPGVVQQVDLFKPTANTFNPNKTLIAIWNQGNDFADAVMQANPNVVAQSIANAITALYTSGMRHFLLFQILDMTKTPALLPYKGSPVYQWFSEMGTAYNGALATFVSQFTTQHTDVRFTTVNTNQFFTQYAPKFKNTSAPCLTVNGTTVDSVCSNVVDHLFWDDTHPTTAGHALLANYVYSLLKPNTA
ncbi:hypothetical protein BZG36_00461 [Bifiguratus adelaidae]|uniref:SGNH hydrolase-type esterase domain-containing protein n=1 Tax=Bifiguratus adelaidae TaxID=1938954 RepID=A0A261Y768_9FUNG|nr:hypothetical protein BZG36_00461 [Bifiguratus adelaidae]